MISHPHRLVEQIFGAKMAPSENFLFSYFILQKLKEMFVDSSFSFVLTVEH